MGKIFCQNISFLKRFEQEIISKILEEDQHLFSSRPCSSLLSSAVHYSAGQCSGLTHLLGIADYYFSFYGRFLPEEINTFPTSPGLNPEQIWTATRFWRILSNSLITSPKFFLDSFFALFWYFLDFFVTPMTPLSHIRAVFVYIFKPQFWLGENV